MYGYQNCFRVYPAGGAGGGGGSGTSFGSSESQTMNKTSISPQHVSELVRVVKVQSAAQPDSNDLGSRG